MPILFWDKVLLLLLLLPLQSQASFGRNKWDQISILELSGHKNLFHY